MPAAYSVGRLDGKTVILGHVNGLGAVRPFPAVVLASVSGYVDRSNSALTHDQMAEAIERLTPADAATHMPHPILWTWRDLLAGARAASQLRAYFLGRDTAQMEGPGAGEFLSRALG
jgi:hypothetical protein